MDLCEALEHALSRVEVERLEDVFQRYSIRELALMWLGLDRVPRQGSANSRAYLSARRRFERYRAGLGSGPRGGRQTRAPRDLDEFLDSLRELIIHRRPPRGRPLTITITGWIQISKDRRHRTIQQRIPGKCVNAIVDALDDGDCETAEAEFAECFGEAAAMGATPEWDSVDSLVAK